MFNHERPHEALGNETPGRIYAPSARMLPSSVAGFQYPSSFLTRRVNNSGDISWHKSRIFVSEVFRNEEIGLGKNGRRRAPGLLPHYRTGRVQQRRHALPRGAAAVKQATEMTGHGKHGKP